MDTTKFSTVKLTQNKLDNWITLNYNVILIGEKGVGKSAHVIDAFNRNNLKWKYFSGATLDPWTDFIGVPKAKTLEDGTSVLEYIKPKYMNHEIEAIFVDEYNRSHKKVKSALMELVQFKSINGEKFPNLRFIWAAINPHNESEDYEVEKIDPAQLDRFHVIVNIPNEPDKKYFSQKFKSIDGTQFVEWWLQQPKEVKTLISPRRLEYAAQAYVDGGDMMDILPATCNYSMLRSMLKMSPTEIEFKKLYTKGEIKEVEKLINDPNRFDEIKKFILTDKTYFILISQVLHNEKLTAIYNEHNKFSTWVDKNPGLGKNKQILQEIKNTALANKSAEVFNRIGKILGDHETKSVSATLTDKKDALLAYCKEYVEEICIKQKKNDRKNATNSWNLKFVPKWLEYKESKQVFTVRDTECLVKYLYHLVYRAGTVKTKEVFNVFWMILKTISETSNGQNIKIAFDMYPEYDLLSTMLKAMYDISIEDLTPEKLEELEDPFK